MEGHHPWHLLLRWFFSYAEPELRGGNFRIRRASNKTLRYVIR